jgi:hypothetical protein
VHEVQHTLLTLCTLSTVHTRQFVDKHTHTVLHDLDLTVVMTNGCNITYSNGLNGLEHWNNVEKITLPLKYSHTAGDTYTVHVTAHQLTATPTQDYALVISGPVTVTEAAVTGLDPASTGCAPVYAVLTEPPVASCTPVAGYPDCCLASASWASYIGDGFCDAAMDSNFDQLNTAACG